MPGLKFLARLIVAVPLTVILMAQYIALMVVALFWWTFSGKPIFIKTDYPEFR